MTTLTPREQELVSFGAAVLRLCLAVDGPLRDVEIALCEDLRSVMLYADDANGNPCAACFDLAEAQVSEDAFDRTPYVDAFADDSAGQ
jgi:hypothetical protein